MNRNEEITSRILIVDDKVENLYALEKVLAPLAVEFVRAAGGNEALKATLKHEFALAILDVHMPGMDGYELLNLLRGQEETRTLPVILLTAHYPDELNIARGYESGAVDFLIKPVTPEILISKAKVFLELDRNRRKLLRQKAALESLARERDLLNKEILEEKDHLEERVKERTMELEQVNKAKDEFLANMSHEIRTPLTGLFGMIDMLLQQDLSDRVQKDLEVIRHSADTVLSLLDDLLDLSRIEKGKLQLNPKSFDLRDMLENLSRFYAVQAAEKDLVLEFSIKPEVPRLVWGDPDRLGQVLKNLLSNALKFTETGTIHLGVGIEELPEQPNQLRFFVADSGIGIPEDKQGGIFQSFTQLDPSYSKKFAGAGLGLAISKRLVELMGGGISVTSEPGKGTTFTFTADFEETNQVEPQGIRSISLADLPPLAILLAEDNPVNRLFLNRALTTAGHGVVEAENGKEVLKQLERKNFDVILMDIQMPEMDGLETTLRIRSNGCCRPDIPIIALTAYAMKGDRERFLASGFNGYVTKPVDFENLTRVIGQACGLTLPE